jgi:hypothetical protein
VERHNCRAKFISAAGEIPSTSLRAGFFGTKSVNMTPIAGFVPGTVSLELNPVPRNPAFV